MQGSTILFSEMTPAPGDEAKFHAWYDEEHIPLRMDVPGFVSAQRYTAQGADAGFLAVYELAKPDVLSSDAYRKVKDHPTPETTYMLGAVSGFTRYRAIETSVRRRLDTDGERALEAPVLYAVWFEVPAEASDAFDAWYEQDHVPLLLKCKDWLMVRRFNVLDGGPRTANRLALHYLSDVAALESPERAAARDTPWRAKMAEQPWFKGSYTLFDRRGPRQIGCVRA